MGSNIQHSFRLKAQIVLIKKNDQGTKKRGPEKEKVIIGYDSLWSR